MSRRKKLLLNTATALLKQLTFIICGFILPRYLLLYYGSSVNGMIASITHFLSFISLLDLGVGAVVKANLYKCLASKDNNMLSKIIISSERFFRQLACIFLAYVAALCYIYPTMVNGGFSWFYTVSLLLIISISTLAQYLFGMTYELLLAADQRSYITQELQIGTIALNTFLAVLMMKMGASVHFVKLATASVYVLRPIGQMIYVHRHYSVNRKVKFSDEPIKQKWNGFSQHLAAVICDHISVIALTLFSTLENVSIYSIYFFVTNGLIMLFMTTSTGLEALFGDIIARNEKVKFLQLFNAVEWITHTGVTIAFTAMSILITPFVLVYTRDITDVDYIVPLFGILLTVSCAVRCIRIPYFQVVKAACHFKETQNGAYIAACVNTAITIVMVLKFGLIGAAIGTLAAMLYHTYYLVWYLKKNIFHRSTKIYIKYLITDLCTAFVSYSITKNFSFGSATYISWASLAVKTTLIVFMVSVLVNAIVYRQQIKNVFLLVKHVKLK